MTELLEKTIDKKTLVVGGRLSGERVSIEFVDGVVYEIEGDNYIAVIMNDGSKVLVSYEDHITNRVLSTYGTLSI